MDFFIIGDVHGCYHTFSSLIEKHWNKNAEVLIQLGDLIDRGKNSPQMVALARKLNAGSPERAVFLKGNHEFEMTEHLDQPPNKNWLRQCGAETLRQYEAAGRDWQDDAEWFRALPLFWETDHLFISHAGISGEAEDAFDENDPAGVLWNRAALKNIGKQQVIGHTPCEAPAYDSASDTWNIDTGAAYSGYLTGVKVSSEGEVLAFIKEATDERDR